MAKPSGTNGSDAVRRAPLTRDAIVAAALEIAGGSGVGKLSMRHLARSLGYEVMSLYNHIPSKDALLTLMIDAIAAEIAAPPDLEPMAAIRALAVSAHDTFLHHPWAGDLWLRHLPGPERIRVMEDLLRLLAESGLSTDLAHFGFHAVNNHVLGHAMQELGMTVGMDDPAATMQEFVAGLSEDEHPHMLIHVRQHMAGEEGDSFELALDLILEGLVRMNNQR